MIQVSEESHQKLKYYCIQNDKKMGKVIEKLIESYASLKDEPKQVLRVK